MRKVTITRERVDELRENFNDVSKTRAVEGESPGKVQRFIWRAARNHKVCDSLCRKFGEELKKITAATPELVAYFEAQAAVLAKYQDCDEQGTPKTHPDGQPYISEEKHAAVGADLEELKKAHQEAMAFVAKRETLSAEYMAEKVDVTLYSVTNEEVPEGVSGVWRLAVEEMISDADELV